jgi:phosphoribosyl-ATP pyrophosphohydrolase
MGYHRVEIEKGEIGEVSKITEEYQELIDAYMQSDKVMIVCELTDLIGAIEEYAKKFNLTLEDLKKFSDKTKSAFLEGKR